MKLNIKRIIKWYGLPIGVILGNITSDYSLQLYRACAILGYLIGSLLYITDGKDE